MKVTFYTREGKKSGTVRLKDGVAVPDSRVAFMLDDHVVLKPGDPNTRLTYEDGPEYLDALPAAFPGGQGLTAVYSK